MSPKPQEAHNGLKSSRILNLLSERSVWVGLLIRLGLAWFLPWALDDEGLLPGVAYTDIDYHVFTDAASYIQQGQSPYERDTYRYTPFLAALLALLPREGGRYLFCLADAACGWMIVHFRQKARSSSTMISTSPSTPIISPQLQDALWWLYNPLAINICTRGSAESLMVLLPVLLTYAAASSWASTAKKSWTSVILASFWHGVAIHSKLYPVIYTLSFMTFFAPASEQRPTLSESKFSSKSSRGLLFVPSYLWSWARRLLQPAPLLFLFTSLTTFALLTYLAVLYYGQQALDEGLLYHFSRVDHRHNYSMHWFWIYLARARGGANMALVGRLLLLPQLTLLFYTSLGIAPHNLSLALFVQTFLFVAHNKVITAQYFTWYLCLLPLCSESLALTRRVAIALGTLLASVLFWLGSAYCLEMQGMAVHRLVWLASVVFFGANVNLLGALLDSYRVKKTAAQKAD
jgi:phosphatidylinositol glycan class M